MVQEINNSTHGGLRRAIVMVGNRNAGKSALLNQIVGQEVSIVSATKGTTTDVVSKAYELDKVGAVSFYDTAGIDDEGELGKMRISATEKALRAADMVLLIIGKDGLTASLQDYFDKLVVRKTAFIPVFTFSDERDLTESEKMLMQKYNGVQVSGKNGVGVAELKAKIIQILSPLNLNQKPLADGLVGAGEVVILVTPQDVGAPKGRLIMPQVQALRELLDMGAMPMMCKESNLAETLKRLKTKPSLVITDSQVVKKVQDILPDDVRLTTFSILFARAKGDFRRQLDGAKVLDELQDGDCILIAEGCSHHISCEDIGRVKIPRWIEAYSQKNITFDFSQGTDFPDDLSKYKLVVMCGGCILKKTEIQHRIEACVAQGIQVTNYGLAISKLQGVLKRVINHPNL